MTTCRSVGFFCRTRVTKIRLKIGLCVKRDGEEEIHETNNGCE